MNANDIAILCTIVAYLLMVLGIGIFYMKKNKSTDGESISGGFDINLKSDGIMQMVGSFTILRISSMGGMVGIEFTKEQLLDMNKKLNKIKLPKNKK